MPQWKDLPRETKAGVIRSLAVHNDEGEEPYPSNSVVSTLSPITLVNRELLEVAGRHSWEKVTVDQSARKGFSVWSSKPKNEEPKKEPSFTEVVLPTRGAHVRLVDCRSDKESSADHLDLCVEVINGCSGVTAIQFSIASFPPELDLPHLHTLLITIDWPRLSVLGLFLESPLRNLTIPFFGGDEDTQHSIDALLPIVGYLKATLWTLDLVFVDNDPEEERLEELRTRCSEQGVVLLIGSYNSMDNNYCRDGCWIDGTPW